MIREFFSFKRLARVDEEIILPVSQKSSLLTESGADKINTLNILLKLRDFLQRTL